MAAVTELASDVSIRAACDALQLPRASYYREIRAASFPAAPPPPRPLPARAGDKLLLYTQKTGVLVCCPLPEFVLKALERLPRLSDRYFFWTGQSKLQTATGHWQAKLKRVFELAGIADGHAHRFRDTFAVELLLAGVPLERVSVMLGHTSIKVTERHYAPWVRARQEQAEADVRGAWGRDPVVLLATKGTPEGHGKRPAVN